MTGVEWFALYCVAAVLLLSAAAAVGHAITVDTDREAELDVEWRP